MYDGFRNTVMSPCLAKGPNRLIYNGSLAGMMFLDTQKGTLSMKTTDSWLDLSKEQTATSLLFGCLDFAGLTKDECWSIIKDALPHIQNHFNSENASGSPE